MLTVRPQAAGMKTIPHVGNTRKATLVAFRGVSSPSCSWPVAPTLGLTHQHPVRPGETSALACVRPRPGIPEAAHLGPASSPSQPDLIFLFLSAQRSLLPPGGPHPISPRLASSLPRDPPSSLPGDPASSPRDRPSHSPRLARPLPSWGPGLLSSCDRPPLSMETRPPHSPRLASGLPGGPASCLPR